MPYEGQTGTAPDGTRVIFRGGRAEPIGGAPDAIAARQEYVDAAKQLNDDLNAYKRVAPVKGQLQRFVDLNRKTETGSMLDAIPGIGGFAADVGFQPGLSEMNSISSAMQVRDLPQGQGQISNFERQLFALGQPGIGKKGPVNENIINSKLALFDQEGDRLAFMQEWLAKNRSLRGAAEAWDNYVNSNPYAITDQSGRVQVNPRRASWRQYFGSAAQPPRQGGNPPAAQSSGAAGGSPAPGTVEGGYRFKGGDPSNANNWVKAQ